MRRILPFLLLAFWAGNTRSADQGSALVYQGRLVAAGAPANGLYDFQFTLWDAAAAGNLVSGPITKSGLPVANGQFATTLDFGAATFSGSERWIEIGVRPAGNAEALVILAPRQQTAALPYALYALNAPSPADYPATRLTGTLADARLSANIPRQSDLVTLSNNLVALMNATSSALRSQINDLSNTLRTNIATGVTVASINPADPALVAQGLMKTFSVAAPPWVNGTTVNQPAARTDHATIWSGQEMIVWGGKSSPGSPLASGGKYRPDLDQWTPVSTLGAPAARSGHTAIWTGTEMIIWGGFGAAGFLGNGGRYTPASQQWAGVATANAPSERVGHVAVWNGSRMMVWGGRNHDGLLNDGALYDPVSAAWTTLALANAPSARSGAVAVWAGDRLLVWGGEGQAGALRSGGQLLFDLAGNPTAWQALSELNAPSPRTGHTAVWTGARLIVWGGSNNANVLADGAAYDPIADAWTALSPGDAPAARAHHLAVWTGREMIVWSGTGETGSLASGAAFDPDANTWRTLQNPGSPLARDHAGGVWNGVEFLVFGGLSNGVPSASLQRLNSQPTWHFYRKL